MAVQALQAVDRANAFWLEGHSGWLAAVSAHYLACCLSINPVLLYAIKQAAIGAALGFVDEPFQGKELLLAATKYESRPAIFAQQLFVWKSNQKNPPESPARLPDTCVLNY